MQIIYIVVTDDERICYLTRRAAQKAHPDCTPLRAVMASTASKYGRFIDGIRKKVGEVGAISINALQSVNQRMIAKSYLRIKISTFAGRQKLTPRITLLTYSELLAVEKAYNKALGITIGTTTLKQYNRYITEQLIDEPITTDEIQPLQFGDDTEG